MSSPGASQNSVESPPLRDSLRLIVVAWLFGSAWLNLGSGAAFTRYAKLLNVTPFGFGLLAAIPFLAAAAQLPTSLFIERHGGRKPVFIWACLLHRFLWLVMGGLPWLIPGPWQWHGLVTLTFLSTVLANVASPAWMSWMADVIPARIRGRFNARRIQAGQSVGLVLSLLAGVALDWPDATQKLLLRDIISAMFAAAGVFGMVDILLFLRVPDPKPVHHHPTLTLRQLVTQPLRNPAFRIFLGYSAMMTLATGFVGQFVWLYVFDEVGMSNFRGNLLLVTIPTLVTMLVYPFWGRVVDRFGSKPALLLAGAVVINGANTWILVTRTSWIPGYIAVLTAVVAWPGVELAGFNLLLRLADSGNRTRASSAVVAINSLAVAIAGTLSGLLGGLVAQWLGPHWRTTVLGWPITAHGVLFLASAVLRAVALLFVLFLKEEKRVATRDALHYMVTNLFSNLQHATFLPVRMLVSLAQQTWRLPIRKPRPRP
jgi:MFS family permease